VGQDFWISDGAARSTIRASNLAEVIRSNLLADSQRSLVAFIDEDTDDRTEISNGELDALACAMARQLLDRAVPGERALVITPPGRDFVVAFLGCLYAGVIAVPASPPVGASLARGLARLNRILTDSRPSVVIGPRQWLEMMVLPGADGTPSPLKALPSIAVDELDMDGVDTFSLAVRDAGDPVFLQYTSGSTGNPKGVQVTHGNLLSNLQVITRHMVDLDDPRTSVVSWLPPYHDMGLIGCLLTPLFAPMPVTLLSPTAFLRDPIRWLQWISRQGATISGGPNFAYDLCARKFTADRVGDLDLSTWNVAFNGAEPLRAETLVRFAEIFAPYGFHADSFMPCYGLAESTLMVSTASMGRGFVASTYDAQGIAEGIARRPQPGALSRTLVASGVPATGQTLAIVDVERGVPLGPRHIGEVWLSGPSVAAGYWGTSEATTEVFGARLTKGDGSTYLRTGDLGFMDDGQLYIAGRVKDVIICAGLNHHPQDLEHSIDACHAAIRPGSGVAVSVLDDASERLLVVQEVRNEPDADTSREICAAIRKAIAEEHNVAVHDIALVPPGSVLKTTSGKLRRSATRDALLRGELRPTYRWTVAEEPSSPELVAAPMTEARHAPVVEASEAAALVEWLRGAVGELARIPSHAVEIDAPIASLGLASVDLLSLLGDLERRLGRRVPTTTMWEYPTIAALVSYVTNSETKSLAVPGRQTPTGARETRDSAVAIIGIGCRFPGGGIGPDGYWRMLEAGVDAVERVPLDRWDANDYYDPDPTAPGKLTTPWGTFVPDVADFDASFFGISPREANHMDPQQRILAEVAWEAIEDAGIPAGDLAGSSTGVFVGISTADYSHLVVGAPERIDVFTGTGNASSIAANRLSYLFDLRGPSVALDSACSSSLVAVHHARQSIASGECSLALAAGVNVILSPSLAINFSKAGVMAPDGRCKSFDARGDGYVRGEGCGVVVLKPLGAAVADNDRIYAVIRGSAVNQDGRSNGLMAPNPAAQAEVLATAYGDAGVDPRTVTYVETHGSGTQIGDPIEAEALGAVLGRGRAPERPLLIGSVKTNIGHLEAAAGIAGLVKAALTVHHQRIPASLHYERPNPHINFDALGLRVAAEAQPWPDPGGPYLAGVSSFGFGGTNAHVVLQDAPRRIEEEPRGRSPVHRGLTLLISGKTREAVSELALRYAAHFEGRTEDDAHRLCSTAAARRTHHAVRLAAVADSVDGLTELLRSVRTGETAEHLHLGLASGASTTRPVWVMSGQGPRWWPLGSEIRDEPVFAEVCRESEEWLSRTVDWRLGDQLADGSEGSRLGEAAVAQPALVAVQISLGRLWQSWGWEPAIVVGHSVGEIAAAHLAGAITLPEALSIGLARGLAIDEAAGSGRMAVAGLPAAELAAAIANRGLADRLWISAFNAPTTAVLSGEPEAIEDITASLEAQGVFARVLEQVSFASHCPLMDRVLPRFRAEMPALRPSETTIPMYSTTLGRRVSGTELGAEYWCRNLRQPVLFSQTVSGLIGQGALTYVEISPHPIVSTAIEECLAECGAKGTVVPSLRVDLPARTTIGDAVGGLYCSGASGDWATYVAGTDHPDMVDLPRYAWQRQRCWLPQAPPHRPALPAPRGLALRELRPATRSGLTYWTGRLDLDTQPELAQHRVADFATISPAFAIDLMRSRVAGRWGVEAVSMSEISLGPPCPVPDLSTGDNLQIECLDDPDGVIRVTVSVHSDGGWIRSAASTVAAGISDCACPTLASVRAACQTRSEPADLFDQMAEAGVVIEPPARRILSFVRSDEWFIAEVGLGVPPDLSRGFITGALQVIQAGATARGMGCLIAEIGTVVWTATSDGFAEESCVVVARREGSPNDPASPTIAWCFDSAGNLLCSITGVRLVDAPVGPRTAIAASAASDLRIRLDLEGDAAMRHRILVEVCLDQAAAVLGARPENLDVATPLVSFGFDSLMSVELRKRLERTCGIRLSPTVAWRYPTVLSMVPYLAQEMGVDVGVEPDEAASTTAVGSPGLGVDDEVDDLTGDEVEMLLRESLADDVPPDFTPPGPSQQ